MCRAMFLLTSQPLSAEALAWEEAPGVYLVKPDLLDVPRQLLHTPHGAIYQIYSSQGCGCGFESKENLNPDTYDDEELREMLRENVDEWQANMRGLERLLWRVAQEQPAFQLCTGWDFREEVTPRRITVGEIAGQQFDEEWDWLRISSASQFSPLP